jgi:diacylglycerol kinase (ATP)
VTATLPPSNVAQHRVAILANPRAGSEQSRRVVEALARRLHAFGLTPVVCWHRRELSEAVAEGGDDLRCVVAAGGDGTVLEVLNRAPGVPVAVLPLGTENLVARYCGVPCCAKTLADVVATGTLRRVDVGRANGRLFCLMASAGFDAAVVHAVHQRRRGHITRFTYGLPLVRLLQTYRFPPIDVEVLDTGERLRGAMVFVFNVPRYGLGLPIAPHAKPDDGRLDVYVFEKSGVLNFLGYGLSVLLRRHTKRPDVHHRQARGFRLSSPEPVPLQTDGDPAGWLPATVEVMPGALTLVVPDQP